MRRLALAALAVVGVLGGTANLDLEILPNDTALLQGAACLDGTPPALYSAYNASNTHWVLYFKGGGWCVNSTDCASRSKGLFGSSALLEQNQPTFGYGGGGPLGDDPSLNRFASFNRVLLWYCDGGSFSGDKTHPEDGLYYRGRKNVDALLRYLRQSHNLGNASEVLVSGGSAGGLAAYLHADAVRATFAQSVKVRAAPVSGFFLNRDLFTATGRDVYELHNASVNAACTEALAPDEQWKCFFANESYAHSTTPTFALNSAVDSYQMGAGLGMDPACAGTTAASAPGPQFGNCSDAQLDAIRGFAEGFVEDIQASDVYSRPGSGGFVESCLEHCAAQGSRANDIKQGNTSMMDALAAWWDAPEDAPASWHLPCTLHSSSPGECNPTCETTAGLVEFEG